MRLYSPTTINQIKEKHGFRLSKSLGQNFLTDKNIIDKIIEATKIGENDMVIEIGPGFGVLTAEAAQLARKVVAIEIDKNLIPILEDTLRDYNNISVVNRDVLKTDINEIIEKYGSECLNEGGKIRILGNLPYYITTPIIMKILEEGVRADSITIMMQKEVADRIKASPGNKTYGALSIAVQYYCEVEDVAKIPKEVFMPRPKVDSMVLRLDVRKEKEFTPDSEEIFFACVKGGFGQRRKTLHNAITGVMGINKEQAAQALENAGIDPMRRAETLNIEDFVNLSNQVAKLLRNRV